MMRRPPERLASASATPLTLSMRCGAGRSACLRRVLMPARKAALPSNLDFAFAVSAVGAASGTRGTDQLARLFDDDVLYEGGVKGALIQPTFLGNHDAGRFGHRHASPPAGRKLATRMPWRSNPART